MAEDEAREDGRLVRGSSTILPLSSLAMPALTESTKTAGGGRGCSCKRVARCADGEGAVLPGSPSMNLRFISHSSYRSDQFSRYQCETKPVLNNNGVASCAYLSQHELAVTKVPPTKDKRTFVKAHFRPPTTKSGGVLALFEIATHRYVVAFPD